MGSPYLSSNESIILSTNDVVVNTVPAEAILTNERLMLIDARHAELRPQDIPFSAIETVTTGENADSDPMLSLSLITGPGVTQAMGIVFPQTPKMKRVAERDEWAARLKELSVISVQVSGKKNLEVLPPWVPGPLPEDGGKGTVAAPGDEGETRFRNPPLVPRRQPKPVPSPGLKGIAVVLVVACVIALAAVAYFLAPALFGGSTTSVTPVTTVPTTVQTTVPATPATPVVTTATVPAIPTSTVITELPIPDSGVFTRVTYDGNFSGIAGAPGRFREINDSGPHVYQLAVKDEIITVTLQKQDTGGNELTIEVFKDGVMVKDGSTTAPKGTLTVAVDLRTV